MDTLVVLLMFVVGTVQGLVAPAAFRERSWAVGVACTILFVGLLYLPLALGGDRGSNLLALVVGLGAGLLLGLVPRVTSVVRRLVVQMPT
jgi:hypothetical protein